MSTKTVTALWSKLAAYLIFVLVLIIIAGLVAVNYSAAIALVIGGLLSWPSRRIFPSIMAKIRGWTRQSWLKIVAVLFVFGFLLLLVVSLFFPFALVSPDCSNGPIVEKYNVIIAPVSSLPGTFIIKETIIHPCPALGSIGPFKDVIINLPERQVNSSPRGLLLKEVSIIPLQTSTGVVNLQLQDGFLLSGPLCKGRCPESFIELRDFPRESFYAAKGAENLRQSPYIDIENITWSIPNLEEGVIFAYIPPPYQYLRPIFEPFAGASSASQLIVGFFGLFGAVIISPIVRPVVLNNLQKKLDSWLEKVSGTKSPEETKEKAKIIISSTGQEKEIDISEKKPKR